jgi:Kef-type K+ transport system membrane component KefB
VVADAIGLATIIGAFAAGLVLATTERRAHIEERIKPVADLLVPVFFVTVGMNVQPAMLNPFAENARFGLAMLLTLVAVASKLVAAVVVYQPGVRRWPVGVGMVPRGEVGLIFAGGGPSRGGDWRGPEFGAGGRGDAHHVRGAPVAEGAVRAREQGGAVIGSGPMRSVARTTD